MILSWMLYLGAISILLGLAAFCLEPLARNRGWPTRGLWMAALLGSFVLPLLALLLPRTVAVGPAPAPPIREQGRSVGMQSAGEWQEPIQSASSVAAFDPDPWLLGGWLILSLLLAVGALLSYGVLVRRRDGWRSQEVDGREVWVSPDLGPAVVGFLRSRIVLPEWMLERTREERALVLSHEEEHLRARDPRLLLGSLLALVAIPWNLALWWIHRRLRQAVELDCDQRVLARGADRRMYSRLLVEVSERGRPHRLAVAAISEPPSFLERRLRQMLTTTTHPSPARRILLGLLASGLVLAACTMDRPEKSPIPATGATLSVAEDGAVAPDRSVDAQTEAMRLAIETRHPELVTQGVEGDRAYVWMLTNSRGEIEGSVVETNPPGRVGTRVEHLERLFPVEDWKARWITGLTTSAGGKIFRSGEIGPDEVILTWWEHAVEGAPAGPYLFSHETPQWTAERDTQRALIDQHHPGVLKTGLREGEMLWFLLNESDEVMKTGRGLPATTTADIRTWLEVQSPTGKIKRRLVGGNYRADGYRFVKVVWATMLKDGELP